jgi:hypothetical protein
MSQPPGDRPLDPRRAREHLDSAAAILRVADRSLHVSPWIFVVWGLFGFSSHAAKVAQAAGLAMPSDGTLQPSLLLAAILATIALTWRDAARETLTDRQAGTVFGVVFGVLLVANFAGQHAVIPYRAMALFWGFGLAMALLIVGLQASRPLLVGGLALLAASAAACRVVDGFHLLLATGWLAGMILPGLVLAWRSRRGRAAAL